MFLIKNISSTFSGKATQNIGVCIIYIKNNVLHQASRGKKNTQKIKEWDEIEKPLPSMLHRRDLCAWLYLRDGSNTIAHTATLRLKLRMKFAT